MTKTEKTLLAANIAAALFVALISLNLSSCAFKSIHTAEVPPPQKETILVMSIDTGVDASHKLLKPYIDRARSVGLDDADKEEHGTHIAGLIIYGDTINGGHPVGLCDKIKIVSCNKLHSGDSDIPYCLRLAKQLKIKYINISGGGLKPASDEKTLMEEMDKTGTVFVLAAGNENADLAVQPYYPASYTLKNSVVVANGVDKPHKSETSNWGIKVVWENGENVLSTTPYDRLARMTGTSQATPIRMHRILRSLCDTEQKMPLPSKHINGKM